MAKTIVGKVIAAILTVFKSNWLTFIVKLWKKVPDELKIELVKIVDIVERIKSFVDSPGIDLLTAVIPGNADDEIVSWLREKLADIISGLNLLDKHSSEYTSSDLHNIATLLTMEVTGLSYGQSAITIENAFQNTKKIA